MIDKLEYNAAGQVAKAINTDGTWTSFVYDNKGNKTYSITSYGYCKTWEYDEHGRLTRHHDSRGNITIREYDSHGNDLYFQETGYPTVRWVRDSEGNLISTTVDGVTRDPDGNLISSIGEVV